LSSTGSLKARPKNERPIGTAHATPLVIEHHGQTDVLVAGKDRLTAFDAKTHKEIWKYGEGEGPFNGEIIVSPVYGDVRGLAPVTLLTGTRDLLYPDARRLAERMQAEGQAVELWEYPDMVHAWMLLPLPEAFEARERVAAMLMRKFGQGRSEAKTDDRPVRDASGSRR